MIAALPGDMRHVIRDTLLKFFLLTLFSLLSFLFLVKPSFAQTPSAPPTYVAPTTNQYISGQSPQAASLAFYNFGHALTCILIGQSPIAPCLEYKFITDAQGTVKSYPILSSVNTTGGLLGLGGSALAMLYTEKPLDQQSFFAYLGRNIGIVKDANAQVGGSGNQVLSPIFALWTVSRNFSYLIMILIFIGVGLMVMFRQKLNPQTVVSVQMALPGLVIGLILITFSYFLAALITDMAYVGTDLVGYYFDEAIKINSAGVPAPAGAPAPDTRPLTEKLADHNPLTVGGGSTYILDQNSLWYFINKFFSNLPSVGGTPAGITLGLALNPQNVVRLFSSGLTYMLYNGFLSPGFDVASSGAGIVGAIIKAKGGSGATSAVATAIGAVPTAIAAGFGADAYRNPESWLAFWATILAVIILLFTIIKLMFRLINNYLMIIFLTLTSPFVFLASSVPGRQGMAVSWMRNMLCNVLSFPAVIGVFYFAAFLMGNNPQIPGFGVTTPLSLNGATGNLPFLGGLDLSFLRRILAFVAILATPAIPDLICKTVGKPGQSGALLAGAIGGAIAGGRQYEGQISGQTQKAGADVGSWRNSLFGQRQFTGGRFGEYQERITPEGEQVGIHITKHGPLGAAANIMERVRLGQAAVVPQSSKNVDRVKERTFKQTA